MSQETDSRLLAKYDQATLTEMQSTNPSEYKMLVYALDNAWYLANYDSQKGDLNKIDMPATDATFLDLGVEISDQNQYFQITGENKILVVKSKWVLTHEMENK